MEHQKLSQLMRDGLEKSVHKCENMTTIETRKKSSHFFPEHSDRDRRGWALAPDQQPRRDQGLPPCRPHTQCLGVLAARSLRAQEGRRTALGPPGPATGI